MLTEAILKEFKVSNTTLTPLDDPTFTTEDELWNKTSMEPCPRVDSAPGKRYEFYKFGRTFGLETIRFLELKGKFLVYY